MNSEERDPSGASGPSSEPVEANPRTDNGPIPRWLMAVIGVGIFWAGAYLFSYSGGFAADVFDYKPKYGAQAAAAAGPPDPKVLGKKLFSANCVTCHQANGQGQPGQFPPLAGSEFVLGDASNRLIAIVLKGLQGPVQVKGQAVMQIPPKDVTKQGGTPPQPQQQAGQPPSGSTPPSPTNSPAPGSSPPAK
jgi:mono/diheme cytochrome c family protein